MWLCPGLVLGILTMDISASANLIMWFIAIIVNGAIYYCLGLAVLTVTSKCSG